MLDIILGMLLGALGGWWLTRRESQPVPMPYSVSPPRDDKSGVEERIVLPGWVATPEPVEDDISDARPEAAQDEPSRGPTVEAYCVRCKTQRPMTNVQNYTTANGRAALKGTCPVCGAGMFTFIKD